jgi:Delta7-sterol 5-desaturase
VTELLLKIVQNYIGAVTSQFGILTLIWLVVWKWIGPRMPAARIQPNGNVTNKQIRREVKNGLLIMAFTTFLSVAGTSVSGADQMAPFSRLTTTGWIIWAIVSIPLLLFINDAWFYTVHRILHSKRLYKMIHNEHHKSLDTTPFTAMSFHFIEPILLSIWVLPVVLFVPVHIVTLVVVMTYGSYDNIKSHLGYEFYPAWFNRGPFRWLTTATYHNMHHRRYNGNYGLHFRLWDRLLGTEFPEYDAEFDALVARRSKPMSTQESVLS